MLCIRRELHLSAILFSIFVVLKPGVPFRTTKALTWPLTLLRAQITTTSANVALPIHRLRPFSRQPPSTCQHPTHANRTPASHLSDVKLRHALWRGPVRIANRYMTVERDAGHLESVKWVAGERTFVAVVCSADASDPLLGSVSPHAPASEGS